MVRGTSKASKDADEVFDLTHIYFAGHDEPEEKRLEGALAAMREPRPLREGGWADWPRCRRPAVEPAEAHSPLLTFILRQSGLDFQVYQPRVLNRRLRACLRLLRATSETAALKVLERKPELVNAALSTILIGVSKFFRDEAVFEHLRKVVLPQALEQNGTVRVLSAGCSAGHELYSVAMVMDELGGLAVSRLLGVDCRGEAIEQARIGEFPVSDLTNLSEARRQRYFRFSAKRAFITPQLRQKTAWHTADFFQFQAAEPWDLILCRNVAIYLAPQYAMNLWHGLDHQLKPGGVVIAGSADPLPFENLGWKREVPCVYRKSLN